MAGTGVLPRHQRLIDGSFPRMPILTTQSPRALALFVSFILISPTFIWAAPPGTPSLFPSAASNDGTTNRDDGDKEGQQRFTDELLKMTEFFDTTLPGTLQKYNLVLNFSPRLPDVRNREFIRFPFTLRYGLREKWEIYSRITPFSPNPLNAGREHRWGLGEISLGVRHDIGRLDGIFDKVTLGLEARTPLGQPPIEITDWYTHVTPYINTSRSLSCIPYTTLYFNLGYERSLDTPSHRAPPAEVVRRHVFNFTPSILYMPGEFGGSFEYSFRYIEDDEIGCHLGHEFKAGPIWDVPRRRTRSWGLPGKWQVDLAYRVTLEEGRSLSQGVSVRVDWRTTIREVFSKKAYEKVPHP